MRRPAQSKRGNEIAWLGLSIRCVFIGLVVVGLAPTLSTAQESGPVTVIVQFDDEVSFGAACVPRSTFCASERNSIALFNEILLPGISTEIEKNEIDRQRRKSLFPLKRVTTGETAEPQPSELLKRPRVLGGQLGYERVSLDLVSIPDIDGNILTTQSHLLWDVQDYTFGVLIPLDLMSLDGFDVTRFGLIGLGQYRFLLNTRTLLTSTVNANYSHAAVDAPGRSNINIFGGGVSVSLTVDQDRFVAGGAFSYQLHGDDSDLENKTQHLFKVGAQVGLRVQDNVAVTLSGTLNYDLTSYSGTVRDVDAVSFDLGLEAGWSLSARWKLTGRYQKVLGLDHFSSDQFVFEALWRF